MISLHISIGFTYPAIFTVTSAKITEFDQTSQINFVLKSFLLPNAGLKKKILSRPFILTLKEMP